VFDPKGAPGLSNPRKELQKRLESAARRRGDGFFGNKSKTGKAGRAEARPGQGIGV